MTSYCSTALIPIHDRHTDVHENSGEARWRSFELFKRFEAIDGCFCSIAKFFHEGGEEAEVYCVVVDEQEILLMLVLRC